MMEPTPELIEALRREEIEDARRLSVERKLALGGELFDYACTITLAGIRMQNSGVTEEKAYEILRQRLALGRRLEQMRAEMGV